MHGKLFLDTNALVALLRGDKLLMRALYEAEWVGTSVVCVLEFMAFPHLADAEKALFDTFLTKIDVISVDYYHPELMEAIVAIRRKKVLQLPDAIVVATALMHQATLVTADRAFADAGVPVYWI